MKFKRRRQGALFIETLPDALQHGIDYHVEMRVYLPLPDFPGRLFIFQHNLVETSPALFGNRPELFHAVIEIQGFAPVLFRLPFSEEEPSARGAILPLEEGGTIPSQKADDHGVGGGIGMFYLIPDDRIAADDEGFAVDRRRIFFHRIVKLFHEFCVARFGLLAQKAGQDGAIRAVPPAGGAQASPKSLTSILWALPIRDGGISSMV